MAVFIIAIGAYILTPLPHSRLDETAFVLRSENSSILNIRLTPDGYWRERVTLDEIDPIFLEMLVAYEDKRFWSHLGVDPLAVVRAVIDSIRHGHVASGASTITMQTARLMFPELGKKTIFAKLHQMIFALRLEFHLSKQEILNAYLTLAPYGGNIEGLKAATWSWLRQLPKTLTRNEAAFLISLPQSPESRRPDRHPEVAARAKNRVLAVVAKSLNFSKSQLTEYKSENIPFLFFKPEPLALHLTDKFLAEGYGEKPTTINVEWQSTVERILDETVDPLIEPINGAVIVAERKTGDVKVYVGSRRYLDQERNGSVNYLKARRSPGSTLKPLIYAYALERNIINENHVFDDIHFQKNGYAPTNFDSSYSGKISLKDALIKSRNIPAIATLEMIGPAFLSNRIKNFIGGDLGNQNDAGLSLAVGGFYLTPEELALIYLELADGDFKGRLSFVEDEVEVRRSHLINPDASVKILDLLSQTTSNGEVLIAKTGTSQNRQDAWAVQLTSEYLILVWLGTHNNIRTNDLSGASVALPLSMRVAEALNLKSPSHITSKIDTREDIDLSSNCSKLIVFPEDGEWIRTADLVIQVMATKPNVEWFLDGLPVDVDRDQLKLKHSGISRIAAKIGSCIETRELFIQLQ